MAAGSVDQQVEIARGFEDLGATHIAYLTAPLGEAPPQAHFDALSAFAEAMQ